MLYSQDQGSADQADVTIVGGGFAGFWAAVAAKGELGTSRRVLLVTPDPYLTIRPRLYEAEPLGMRVDLRPIMSSIGVELTLDRTVRVEAREITLASQQTVGSRRIVLATGSVMRSPDFPGSVRGFSIDTAQSAADLERRLAILARRRTPISICVVGGGFTGIEAVLELRDRVARLSCPSVAEAMELNLIDRSPVIGGTLGNAAMAAINEALHEARVNTYTGAAIRTASADGLHLEDGQFLKCDLFILTIGLVASPLAQAIAGRHDALGRLFVDRHLRVPEIPTLFAAGDVAAAYADAERLALQSCQHALQLGRVAGANAARDLLGKELYCYRQERYVTCVDLGRSGAVLTQGWERDLVSTGVAAKKVKRRINRELIYPPMTLSPAELFAKARPDRIESTAGKLSAIEGQMPAERSTTTAARQT